MQKKVLSSGADLGIALDGDGDRVIMADREGELIDGDELLYIIATARQKEGNLEGGVVGTVMSNFGLELALKERNIPFLRTPVGDRHIHRALVENGWTLGGEASGHILSLDRTSTGDGIVSALQVLEIMVRSGKGLTELKQGMQKFPQTMINVPVSKEGQSRLSTSHRINTAVRDIEAEMNGKGRVILRPSGTEPLIRVTLEGADSGQVERLANQLADTVREELLD
jgi:phosphoglucosamine mutase